MLKLTSAVIVTLGFIYLVNGHGYMQEPPARNSMWRFGFDTPKNYKDNENFCGGRKYQADNGGKCGVCGDPYGKPQHHNGGRFDTGTIVRDYNKGQVIDVEIYLTTSHLGHFEFRIGPKAVGDSIGKLQGRVLKLETGEDKFMVKKYGRQLLKIRLQLPAGYTCKKCVIQWWYRGGNNWGCQKNPRKCGQGLGKNQEHFVNCADVSVQ